MKEKSEDQIIRTEYSEVMQKSYIDYAMSVIISRALPDVRDGLKLYSAVLCMTCMSSASSTTSRSESARVSSAIRWVNTIRTATVPFTMLLS